MSPQMQSDWNKLAEMDRSRVWHPYAKLPAEGPIFPVVSADGVRLRLADGTELIDGMASWWCAIHGYNHPVLNRAITDQLGSMAHVMFGGLTHAPAIRLATKLAEIAPAGLETVFFADSGSVSVEVAIKMAIQYQRARGQATRQKLLALRGAYHGDTLGAMAACDPVTGMHAAFRDVLAPHFFADRPAVRFGARWNERDVSSLAILLDAHEREIAAVILEPIAQGAGGMWFYHPECLRRARALCDEHGVLLIADEIATGFGRTGKLFACEHAGVMPDILCLGKALTGGTMTLAATLATREVAETVSRDGPLMHGPTFMANPLACSVALASIGLLESSGWREKVSAIEAQLARELEPCRRLPGVADVRVLGAIGVVEMKQPVDMRLVPEEFVKRGVWVRPFDRLVYVMPPYIISPADLSRVTGAIREVVQAL
jgi:adenosylmethionine-8-amino-7-oxononanoate aminotransferase